MKKFAFGFAAAVALGLASLTAPAVAMPIAPGSAVQAASDIVNVQYRRHGHVHRHRQVCTTRRVVSRGPHGRPIVRHVRVCR